MPLITNWTWIFIRELLKVFYEDDIDLELENPKDIYLSRTWKDSESPLADYVCQKLLHPGIRLIGDSTDNPSFGEDRIRRIIASCGGLLAILPFRGEGGSIRYKTSKYMIEEIEIALELQLPLLIVA